MKTILSAIYHVPIRVIRFFFRQSPSSPIPENQMSADIDKLDQRWRENEKVRARQLAATTKGGRG